MVRPDRVAVTGIGTDLARCVVFTLLFAGAARLLPRVDVAALVGLGVVLATPAAIALLHRGTVRRLAHMHEFAPGRWLHTWAGRRRLAQFAGIVGALALALVVLLQSPFFGRLEWTLVAVAPLVFVGFDAAFARRLRPLFAHRVYAANAAARLARWITFTTLCIAWIVGRYLEADAPTQPIAQLTYELQNAWPDPPSALVRWAIDAGAWGAAALASLGHVSDARGWRVALAVVILPLTLFGFITWSIAGLAIGRDELRRILAPVPSTADAIPLVPRVGVRIVAAMVASIVLATLVAGVYGDAALRQSGRLLALRALPQCERLGGMAYAVGTLAKVDAYRAVLERGIGARKAEACARVATLRAALERQVDAYLDWYFSFGADVTQTILLATGEVGALLEFKLGKLVSADPQVTALIGELDADAEYITRVRTLARSGIADLLEQQRLVLDEGQCRVVAERATASTLPTLRGEQLQVRLFAGGVGAVAGGLAGAFAARAMGRASMKAAQRVMTRLGVKLASRATGAAAGAGTGGTAGSVVPGAGTVIGMVVGAVTGWVATDLALLAAEEQLTRAGMRADLMVAVDETLAPLRASLGCAGP